MLRVLCLLQIITHSVSCNQSKHIRSIYNMGHIVQQLWLQTYKITFNASQPPGWFFILTLWRGQEDTESQLEY